MSVKDLPFVTSEQVNALRDKAIELEQQLYEANSKLISANHNGRLKGRKFAFIETGNMMWSINKSIAKKLYDIADAISYEDVK